MTRSRSILMRALLALGCASFAASAAYVAIISLPGRFRAHAGVSLVAQAEDLAPWGREAALRRRALVALVPDLSIANGILSRFGENLPGALRTPEAILACIETDDLAGDLLQIHARTADPGLSTRLANAWAEAFVEKTNSAGAFSGEADSIRQVEATLAATVERHRRAEAAVLAHDASSRMAELHARRDRVQALLSHAAEQRAELVHEVWTHLHRARMARAERAVRDAEAGAEAARETGVLDEIRGILAGLGVHGPSDADRVAPISTDRLAARGPAGGLAPAGGRSVIQAANADLDALEREDAAEWEKPCLRLSGEVEALSSRLYVLESERRVLEEARSAASDDCASLTRQLGGLRAAAVSRPPLVRLALVAAPPAKPEGPDPIASAAVAAAIGGLAGLLLRPRRAPEFSATPRVFRVLP